MVSVDYPSIMNGNPQAPTARRVGTTLGPQFVQALRDCANYQGQQCVYICSLIVSPIDVAAGKQIAWLRKQAFALGQVPTAEEERGAMGEWLILRRAKHLGAVRAVSLVSMSPVSDPDLIIEADPARGLAQVDIDIKTTAAKSPPQAHYNLLGNQAKRMPHFLVAVLATKKNPHNFADLYFVNTINTLTPNQWLTVQQQLGKTGRTVTPRTSHSIAIADAFGIR